MKKVFSIGLLSFALFAVAVASGNEKNTKKETSAVPACCAAKGATSKAECAKASAATNAACCQNKTAANCPKKSGKTCDKASAQAAPASCHKSGENTKNAE